MADAVEAQQGVGLPLLPSQVDPRGNAPGATPADYTTTLRYDPAGQLVETTDPSILVK
jgi:YD repeat-containing protein